MSYRRPARRPVRRSRAALVALPAALALLLTGCSSSDGGAGGGSSAKEKVATKFGEITVPEKPQRVVALGWGDAETALALGVEPVGQSDWLAFGGNGVGPWAKGRYSKKPKKIGTLEPEYEKVAALKPDLILDTKSSGDKKRYDTLRKIAPTVGVPKGGDQYMTSWEQQTKMVAAALGEKSKGNRLISRVNKQFKATAAKYPEFKGKTITLGSRTSAGYGAYVHGTGRTDFVERLGFKNNPKVDAKAGSGFSVTVSRENLRMLDADLTVMAPIGISAKKITDDKLYRQVPSVKAGRSVMLDDPRVSQAFATDSVLSVQDALKTVTPLFSEKLKHPEPLSD